MRGRGSGHGDDRGAAELSDQPLLDEQLAYYRERVAEYDEWWERIGRYDRGPEHRARWMSEIAEVRAVFDSVPLGGDVVELASGTGYWTELLASRARHVTAVDASPEMIAVNRERLGDLASKVDYERTDLFEWSPSRRWDGMVFCFWISHVPRARLDSFLGTCRAALTPGACMFFLDGQRVDESTAVDHGLPDEESEVMIRRLNDGREFHVVKNYYEPDLLIERAAAAGFDLRVHGTGTFFQYGLGQAR